MLGFLSNCSLLFLFLRHSVLMVCLLLICLGQLSNKPQEPSSPCLPSAGIISIHYRDWLHYLCSRVLTLSSFLHGRYFIYWAISLVLVIGPLAWSYCHSHLVNTVCSSSRNHMAHSSCCSDISVLTTLALISTAHTPQPWELILFVICLPSRRYEQSLSWLCPLGLRSITGSLCIICQLNERWLCLDP